jgi:cytochrome P450
MSSSISARSDEPAAGRSKPRIEDFSDPRFDPFATFDRATGQTEVSDPYPRFHELHAAGNVQPGDIRESFDLQRFGVWARYPSYMVFGHENVARALLEAKVFSNTIAKDLYSGAFGESINALDPPQHTRYRALLQQAFLPRPLKVWGTEIVPAVVAGIIGKFKDRGSAELVSEFTLLFPFEIIYAQLGLPEDELDIFHRLSTGLMCTLIDYEHAHEASLKMGTYLAGLLE